MRGWQKDSWWSPAPAAAVVGRITGAAVRLCLIGGSALGPPGSSPSSLAASGGGPAVPKGNRRLFYPISLSLVGSKRSQFIV